jgi:hypothetical protein
MSGEIEFEWILQESERDARIAAIESAGGTVDDSGSVFVPRPDEAHEYAAAGFEPLLVIVGVSSIVFLVQTLAKAVRNAGAVGGTVIDVRGDRVRIRSVPRMTAGRLIIIDQEGQRAIDEASDGAAQALLSQVLAVVSRRGAPKAS